MHKIAAELRHRELTQEIYNIGDEVAEYLEHLIEAIEDWDEELCMDCLAELGDIGRFTHARAVTAFAGLDPRLQESGTFHGRTCISRTGSARLRTALYLPAVVALTHNPAIKAQAEQRNPQRWLSR